MSLRFSKSSGFSLIEMLVVISIFVIVTGIVLVNLPSFRDKSSLDLVAQEIALTIRQAQVFGIGTRAFGGSVYPSHGIYLDPAQTQQFVLFADLPTGPGSLLGDRLYNKALNCGQTGSECREIFRLGGGISLEGIYRCPATGCDSSKYTQPVNIVFQRPRTDASFYISRRGSPTSLNTPALKIRVQNKVGSWRDIMITKAGHIYVQKS